MSELGMGVLGASSTIYRAVIVDAVAAVDGVSVVHEASRSAPVAGEGVRTSQDYAAVLEDERVDLVYIPLPNHLHEEWVLACAEAGKHVLCEKPLAPDAAAAARMAHACDDAGVVLLEAYMSPFHPRSQAVVAALREGRIGRVVHGEARMCGVMPASNHRWKVANGGGALLDVGIYCLEPILSAFGWPAVEPQEVCASSDLGGDGVDRSTSAWLTFPDGGSAHLFVSFAAPDQQRLQLTGTDGAIEVPVRHATPDRRDGSFLLRTPDGAVSEVSTDTGSCYEGLIAHTRDVVSGRAEPLRDAWRSVALAHVTDRIVQAART